MAQFVTADEFASYLRATFTVAEQAQADELLTIASGMIQTDLGQSLVEVAGDTLTRRGQYGREFRLPERPVTAVTSVTIDGTALDAEDWYLQGDTLVRTVGGWGDPTVEVEVVYTHGYATIPDAIKAVVLSVAARAWGNPAGVSQESVDGYSITYMRGSSGVFLTAEERQRLARYRRTAGTVQAR